MKMLGWRMKANDWDPTDTFLIPVTKGHGRAREKQRELKQRRRDDEENINLKGQDHLGSI